MSFVHLHTHSHYSLLDGMAKIDDLVKEAVKMGMPALALTDHGNMYGAIEFYKKCKKNGIKPIIGVEFYVAYELMSQKRPGIDDKRYHLVLLAENEIGYRNLIKLVTLSNLQGFYYKPRIDREILRKHSEGLIGLSACLAGELPRFISRKDFETAEKIAKEYEQIFGKGNFYIEIGHHPNIEKHDEIRDGLVELAKKLNMPLVATQDIHYLKSEDATAQDFLVAIQTNASMADANRLSMRMEDFSMRPPEQMIELFKDFPGAAENTLKIAEQCNLELELGKWVFPKIELPEGQTAKKRLREMVNTGYEKHYGAEKDAEGNARKRLEYELEVIISKGYAPYFLVVSEIINYARDNGIFTNTRGSAAGSLVSFLLGITNIDPIKYHLPFERFLNPERPSPPDIDMDFADNKRDAVIKYVKEKYGENRVAQIGTFGTMMARAAVRDITRALGKPYDLGDKIAKLIPMGSKVFPMTLDQAIKMVPELDELYKKDTEVTEIINLAKKIEGCARHISVHAAGVVIAPTELTDFVPLQYEPKGEKIITQYDMHAVEDAGLLKFDFLGIKNLTILENSVQLVKKFHGIEIDIINIPLDDKKTFELLERGDTLGLFQLNGAGMTRWLKELKPHSIWDIMAMIALFRPGPMAFIPDYIQRKENPRLVTYLDPQLKDILEPTYGIIIYQDDILLIATRIAGYSWGEADKFRKAVGKKIPKEMAAQKEKFINGCVDHGHMELPKAQELWDMIETFAAYGFNKAHTASYGKVAYQTAYMKANYPIEFMTAVLTSDAGDTEKIAAAITECKRMKIPVLPPNINESFGDFTAIILQKTFPDVKPRESSRGLTSGSPQGDSLAIGQGVTLGGALGIMDKNRKIRFGLYTIKNLGEEISNAIIEEREKNGKFKSFSDFLDRIKHKNLNKKSLEALIKSGAMDELGERNQLLENTEDALTYNREAAKLQSNQNSLFALMEDTTSIPVLKLKEVPIASQQDKLLWEKELLGLYISGHPLDRFSDKLEKIKARIKNAKEMTDNMPIVTAGMIEEIRKIMTKKNNPMLFVKLSDYTDSIECVVFPKILAQFENIMRDGNCIAVKGKISLRNGDPSIICEQIKEMSV